MAIVAVAAVVTLIVGYGATVVLRAGEARYPDAWDPRIESLVRFVEAERGAPFRHPVHVDFVESESFDESVSYEPTDEERAEAERYSGLYRAFGLAGGELDLFATSEEAATANILAYYSPETERITIEGTELTAGVSVTVVHELGHAFAALMTGQLVKGIHLRIDHSGAMHSLSRRNSRAGAAWSGFWGYPAPAVVGAALVWAAYAGWSGLALSVSALLFLATLLFIRNWQGVLIAAAYVPRNHFKAWVGHPMVLGTALWALAHLQTSRTAADVLLFGGFLLWAAACFVSLRSRDRAAGVQRRPGQPMATLIAVAIGVAAWAVFAFWLHALLIGIAPYG